MKPLVTVKGSKVGGDGNKFCPYPFTFVVALALQLFCTTPPYECVVIVKEDIEMRKPRPNYHLVNQPIY